MMRDILVIGGTGVFGKRLVRHLANQSSIALHVSSRSAEKAKAFIQSLEGSEAAMHPVALDCKVNLQACLSEIRPFIVVDCSGPFQGLQYDTAHMALEAGAHFIDIADARDYLANFVETLDETAHRNAVSACTGASSTPTLSTCVALQLTANWQRVDTVDICIVPGGRSEVGQSVIKAIMSYAGKDIPIWSAGRLSHTTGWQNAKKVDIPGLRRARVAAVETYDAEYLGAHLNVQSRVSFSAGLESRIEQWGIEAVAALCKRGIIKSPNFLIPTLLKARMITRIPTSSTGGMHVNVSGLDQDGLMTQAQWSLIAQQDHGPFTPILPAAAVIQKLLSGAIKPGACLAHDAVTLSDIVHEMRPYNMNINALSTHTKSSIFEQALGHDAFTALPAKLMNLHTIDGPACWSGKADIDRGFGALSKAAARLFSFPDSGKDVPVTVTIDRKVQSDGSPIEIWERTFAGKPMTSTLGFLQEGVLSELFWPFMFSLKLGTKAKGIQVPVLKWRIGKLPLPSLLAPRSETAEFVDEEGRFRFDVKLSAPLIGEIVHYRGWLEPNKPD